MKDVFILKSVSKRLELVNVLPLVFSTPSQATRHLIAMFPDEALEFRFRLTKDHPCQTIPFNVPEVQKVINNPLRDRDRAIRVDTPKATFSLIRVSLVQENDY